MESLGGDQLWVDRFLAYHSSLLYYWALVGAVEDIACVCVKG